MARPRASAWAALPKAARSAAEGCSRTASSRVFTRGSFGGSLGQHEVNGRASYPEKRGHLLPSDQEATPPRSQPRSWDPDIRVEWGFCRRGSLRDPVDRIDGRKTLDKSQRRQRSPALGGAAMAARSRWTTRMRAAGPSRPLVPPTAGGVGWSDCRHHGATEGDWPASRTRRAHGCGVRQRKGEVVGNLTRGGLRTRAAVR